MSRRRGIQAARGERAGAVAHDEPRSSDPAARHGLTSAGMSYFIPDQPGLLQRYIWHAHDVAPGFHHAFQKPGAMSQARVD